MSNKKSEIEAFLAEAAEQQPKTEAVFPIREKMKAEFDTLYNGYIIESYNEGIEGEYGVSTAVNLIDNLQVIYDKKHSQELTWDYTYSDNIDFLRQQNNKVYFDVYARMREDNDLDDLGREIKYKREKFKARKSLDWVLDGSLEWNLSGYKADDIGTVQKFSYIFRYDRFTHNHRNEIAILLRIDGEWSILSQTITSSGPNTAGIAQDSDSLDPTDSMKISRHLTEEEKNTSVSRKFTVANQEFDLKNNLEQVPISVTRKKAKVRGNKPYSSST